METLNRLITPPTSNSREMRAYMQAILEVTGLMAGESFPMELFMKNYATHLKPKTKYPYPTLHKNPDGTYQLTPKGVVFFSSRLTASPIIKGQKVGRADVAEMQRAILASEPGEGWEAFPVELSANT